MWAAQSALSFAGAGATAGGVMRLVYLAVLALAAVGHSELLAAVGPFRWIDDGTTALPLSVNWTSKGAINAVLDENQHGCFGACWAFSSVAAIEAAHFVKTGELIKLSEQQMLDCAGSKFGNSGCSGGLMDGAYRYAITSGDPLCKEANYSYYGPVGKCRARTCSAVGLPAGAVVGYRDVHPDEKSLMAAVAQQPLSVAVRGAMGDKNAFQNFTGGRVLTADCDGDLGPDHGVLLAGYGVTPSGVSYWLIKNSYGRGWGDDGYAMLERGKGGTGECGILSKLVSFPVLR